MTPPLLDSVRSMYESFVIWPEVDLGHCKGNSNQKQDKNSHDEQWVHKKSQRLEWARRTWDMRGAWVKGVIKDHWSKSRVETMSMAMTNLLGLVFFPWSSFLQFQERRTQQIGSEAVEGEGAMFTYSGRNGHDSLQWQCGAGAALQIIRCSDVAWPDHWLR